MKINTYMNQSLLPKIQQTQRALNGLAEKILAKEKISWNEALVLVSIFHEKGKPVTPKDLGLNLGIAKVQVSQTLTKLEERGLVKRTLSQNDARSYFIELSSASKIKAKKLINSLELIDQEIETFLDKNELETILRLLGKVISGMEHY